MFRLEDLPALSPLRVPQPTTRAVSFGGPSSSAAAASTIPRALLAPISEAEAARMVKIKEEAFDEEGHFNPGWREQFIGAPTPEPRLMPVEQYLIRNGEVLFPPAVLRQGFEVMQDKFLTFTSEFSQLMLSMSNMSQVIL